MGDSSLFNLDLEGDLPEYREMEEMDQNYPDSRIYGQPSAQFDQSHLTPRPYAFSGPFDHHFPPTPVGTSMESAHGQMGFDNGTIGHGLGPMMGYQSPQPYNVDYTTPSGVQLPTGSIQGKTTSEEDAAALTSQMNQWFKLIRESVTRLSGDREQLFQIRQRFHEGFCDINKLFDEYLGVTDAYPSSDDSSSDTPRSLQNNSKKVFSCGLCGGKLMNRGTFQRHVIHKHKAPAVYKCPYCPLEMFPRRDKATSHIDGHSRVKHQKDAITQFKVKVPGPFQCDYCKIEYDTWDGYWVCFQSHSQVIGGVTRPRHNGHNGGGGNYGGGASGAGASGAFGGQIPGSLGGTGHQHSHQGHGAYQPGGYSGYSGYNRHHGASVQDGESPLSESPCLSTPCSEASSPEPPTLLSDLTELLPSVKRVHPPPPKNMESTLTRALHARHSSAPALARETRPDELGLIPKDPDHSPRDVNDGPRDSCKSCGHLFKGCDRCRTQKHVVDGCHACADKTCSLPQPAPLRIEIPRSRLLSKDASTNLWESSSLSSEQDDTSLFDELQHEHLDNGPCGTAFTEDLSGKWKINNDAMQEWIRKPAELDFLKDFATRDHGSRSDLSCFTRILSEAGVGWSFTARTWAREYGVPSKDSKLISSRITRRPSTMSLKLAEGGILIAICEMEFRPFLAKGVVSGSLYRSAMLCDPGLRIMLPFLGFYGLGSKADLFTKGRNMIPNIALQGTSFIAKQMQSEHHDAPILRDAASTAAKAVSRKRSARLRKKLQAVARVLARYASVANAAPGTDKQAIACNSNFDSKSTTPSGEVTRVGDGSAGPDSQALLERICEIISFINTGMTDMFASPEYTFLDCDDDDDDNGMRWVMAFFWQFLIAILRMRNGSLIATDVVACT